MTGEAAETGLVSDGAVVVLNSGLARLAGIRFGEQSFDHVVRLVADLACETIGAADAATLTFRRHGSMETYGCTDETFVTLDDAQYEAGDGPCVRALLDGAVVHAADDLSSWPALAERARGLGIRSVLSTPLSTVGEAASLNLYSRSPGFGEEDRRLCESFAEPASVALANAMAYSAAAQLADNLREAIATREIIGEAKGILMARQSCTADEAFDILRRASQRTNRKLRDIAVDLVSSTEHNPSRGESREGTGKE